MSEPEPTECCGGTDNSGCNYDGPTAWHSSWVNQAMNIADPSRWLKWRLMRWIYRRWRRKHPRTITIELVKASPDGNCTLYPMTDFSKLDAGKGDAK